MLPSISMLTLVSFVFIVTCLNQAFAGPFEHRMRLKAAQSICNGGVPDSCTSSGTGVISEAEIEFGLLQHCHTQWSCIDITVTYPEKFDREAVFSAHSQDISAADGARLGNIRARFPSAQAVKDAVLKAVVVHPMCPSSTPWHVQIKRIVDARGAVIRLHSSNTLVAIYSGVNILADGVVVDANALPLTIQLTGACGVGGFGRNGYYTPDVLLSRISKPVSYMVQQALVLNGRFSGYFHFITEILPRLHLWLPFLKVQQHTMILLSARMKPFSFASEAFCLLGVPEQQLLYVNDDDTVHAAVALMPEINTCGDFNARTTILLNHTLASAPWNSSCFINRPSRLDDPANDSSKIKLLFITRRDASTRKIRNIDDLLEPIAAALPNATIIEYDSKYNFHDTAMLFREADIVVAPHGAGLTNLIFCRKGTAVIEFLEPRCNAPSKARDESQTFIPNACYEFENICYKFGFLYTGIPTPMTGNNFDVNITEAVNILRLQVLALLASKQYDTS